MTDTAMDRRAFFFSLAAAGIAGGLALPVGMDSPKKYAVEKLDETEWTFIKMDSNDFTLNFSAPLFGTGPIRGTLVRLS